MREEVEATIVPTGITPQEVELKTTEKTKTRTFSDISQISSMLAGDKFKRAAQQALSLALLAGAVTEASKPIFPLISEDLAPLSNYPILNQYSAFLESPAGVGALAAIGAVALGVSSLRDRVRLQAVEAALRHVRICPPDTPLPPNPPETP